MTVLNVYITTPAPKNLTKEIIIDLLRRNRFAENYAPGDDEISEKNTSIRVVSDAQNGPVSLKSELLPVTQETRFSVTVLGLGASYGFQYPRLNIFIDMACVPRWLATTATDDTIVLCKTSWNAAKTAFDSDGQAYVHDLYYVTASDMNLENIPILVLPIVAGISDLPCLVITDENNRVSLWAGSLLVKTHDMLELQKRKAGSLSLRSVVERAHQSTSYLPYFTQTKLLLELSGVWNRYQSGQNPHGEQYTPITPSKDILEVLEYVPMVDCAVTMAEASNSMEPVLEHMVCGTFPMSVLPLEIPMSMRRNPDNTAVVAPSHKHPIVLQKPKTVLIVSTDYFTEAIESDYRCIATIKFTPSGLNPTKMELSVSYALTTNDGTGELVHTSGLIDLGQIDAIDTDRTVFLTPDVQHNKLHIYATTNGNYGLVKTETHIPHVPSVFLKNYGNRDWMDEQITKLMQSAV